MATCRGQGSAAHRGCEKLLWSGAMLGAHIDGLLERAAAGERLSAEEGLLLYREADLNGLGLAANAVRQLRVPGKIVTYLVDRNINYSNVCTTNCTFCGFYL